MFWNAVLFALVSQAFTPSEECAATADDPKWDLGYMGGHMAAPIYFAWVALLIITIMLGGTLHLSCSLPHCTFGLAHCASQA